MQFFHDFAINQKTIGFKGALEIGVSDSKHDVEQAAFVMDFLGVKLYFELSQKIVLHLIDPL